MVIDMKKLKKTIPGFLLLLAVGLAAKYLAPILKNLAHNTIPQLAPLTEYVLLAIIFGLIIRNVFGVHNIFKPGIKTYEFWLKMGIVFLGARFLLQELLRLSAVSLILVIIEIFVAIGLMILIGKWFGLNEKLKHLLAVGSSVCGVSAIIGAQGAVKANDEDLGFAIAAILALGAFGVFIYPLIGNLIGMSDTAFGLWAGLAIDNTAEVVAGGSLFSEQAATIAVAVKNTRNALMGFVILGFAIYWAKKHAAGAEKILKNKWKYVWEKFPKFVLGFFAFSILSTLAFFNKEDIGSLKNAYKWCFMLTFAGVGLQTDFREMKRIGLKPFVVGSIAELTVAAVTLGMVLLADVLVGL